MKICQVIGITRCTGGGGVVGKRGRLRRPGRSSERKDEGGATPPSTPPLLPRPYSELSPTGGRAIPSKDLFDQVCRSMPGWDYEDVRALLDELVHTAGSDDERKRAIEVLTLLMDRRYAIGRMKRSYLL